MRKPFFRRAGLVIGVAAFFVAVPSATAQEEGRITVAGEADVRVVPDEVVLTLGVETDDLDLQAA
ncbi:MAG: hypothetical protein M8866_06735, partial [marine benthic group bacterium]|nr:hypothetical protein [Candidatus Benthicola marisminoris]